MDNADLTALRHELMNEGLEAEVLGDDPILAFDLWFEMAGGVGVFEHDAMTVATASVGGVPSARVVLLRSYDHRGFVWFTDHTSAKGLELAENPNAALVIAWPELARQVRAAGPVETTTAEESDAYWRTRPRGSQIAAVASRQSEVLASRAELDEARAEVERELEGKPVPRPPHWGGYRLRPARIEFWQGREFRAHDRILFERDPASPPSHGWAVSRLWP